MKKLERDRCKIAKMKKENPGPSAGFSFKTRFMHTMPATYLQKRNFKPSYSVGFIISQSFTKEPETGNAARITQITKRI